MDMDTALVDSNILLILTQPLHPKYSVTMVAVAKLLSRDFDLCIVPQNLIEFWAVATRPSVSRGGLGMKPDAVDIEINRSAVYEVQKILTFNGDDFKRYPGIVALDPANV